MILMTWSMASVVGGGLRCRLCKTYLMNGLSFGSTHERGQVFLFLQLTRDLGRLACQSDASSSGGLGACRQPGVFVHLRRAG